MMVKEKMKKQIAVVGGREFTLGFKLAGVREVHEPGDFGEKIIEMINRDDLAIVVVEEDKIKELPDRKSQKVEKSVDPVVVKLSENAESSNLQEKIRKVIGADIS